MLIRFKFDLTFMPAESQRSPDSLTIDSGHWFKSNFRGIKNRTSWGKVKEGKKKKKRTSEA